MAECKKCGHIGDIRLGFCFGCANSGERRLAKRTTLQHMASLLRHLRRRCWFEAKCDARYAIERLTRTGAYSRGGYFDGEGHD